MIRKFLSVLFALIVIAIIVFGYFYLKNRNRPVVDLKKAIPIDASFFIEGNNFNNTISELVHNNSIFEEFNLIPSINSFTHNLKILDSISSNKNDLNELIFNKSFALSAHYSGYNDLDFLYLVRLEEILQEKLALNAILNHFDNISGRNYEKTKIYGVYLKANRKNPNFFFSITSGLILISKSEALLESSIRQINSSPSIYELNGFNRVFSTAGKNTAGNFYLNYKHFKKLIISAKNKRFTDLLTGKNNYANWSEFDINIRNESILLNGFTYANDSAKMFMNIFKGQKSDKCDILEILPANTAMLLYFSIDDYLLYLNNYKNHFIDNTRNNTFIKENKKLQENTEINIYEEFIAFFDDQIALVITDFKNLSINENTYVVLKTKSQSLSKDRMLKIINDFNRKNKSNIGPIESEIKIDNDTKIKVYKMPVSRFSYKLFGQAFSEASCNYFIFIENYLVFGHSPQVLKSFMHANILHKTMVNDKQYIEFYDKLSSRSNMYFYCNISRSHQIFKSYLSKSLYNLIQKSEENFNKFQAIGFQFSGSRNMFYHNLYLKYNTSYKGESRTLWESRLDTIVKSKPFIVKNHYTQNKEIFVQDFKNNIYLLNNKGRVLWKKKLSENIMSNIFQIDFYKNGKLQYLFNTSTKIHLIDRNGNYVERYPIKLNSKASNGINVFDYDKNKNYRIFLALENKKIKVFNTKGNIVPGWTFDKTEYVVKKEIKHFRVENKDYIVLADKARVYILNRKGKERAKLQKQFSSSEKNNFILEKRNSYTESRFVTTDSKGVIHFIYLDGKVETKVLKSFNPLHFFDYQDINGDNLRDFIFVENNQLLVYSNQGEKLFEYRCNEQISAHPVTYSFSNNNKRIGLVTSDDRLIYLLNYQGKLINGFPMSGQSQFSIGKLNPKQEKFNLIVGGENNFLYNYYLN